MVLRPRNRLPSDLTRLLGEIAREVASRFSVVERILIVEAITLGALGKAPRTETWPITTRVWPMISDKLKARILLFRHLADSTHNVSTLWVEYLGGPKGVRH